MRGARRRTGCARDLLVEIMVAFDEGENVIFQRGVEDPVAEIGKQAQEGMKRQFGGGLRGHNA